MTATLIALTLICLAALAGSARSGSSTAPTQEDRAGLTAKRATLHRAQRFRCLPLRQFRWKVWEIPNRIFAYVATVQTPRWIVGVRSRPRQCTPVEIGRVMAAAQGWTGSQWEDLYELWNRESGWHPCKHYPRTINCHYTGRNACGIPQRYPCNGLIQKSVRAQIRWGLGYIASRHGSPSGALAHSNAYGWY